MSGTVLEFGVYIQNNAKEALRWGCLLFCAWSDFHRGQASLRGSTVTLRHAGFSPTSATGYSVCKTRVGRSVNVVT